MPSLNTSTTRRQAQDSPNADFVLDRQTKQIFLTAIKPIRNGEGTLDRLWQWWWNNAIRQANLPNLTKTSASQPNAPTASQNCEDKKFVREADFCRENISFFKMNRKRTRPLSFHETLSKAMPNHAMDIHQLNTVKRFQFRDVEVCEIELFLNMANCFLRVHKRFYSRKCPYRWTLVLLFTGRLHGLLLATSAGIVSVQNIGIEQSSA